MGVMDRSSKETPLTLNNCCKAGDRRDVVRGAYNHREFSQSEGLATFVMSIGSVMPKAVKQQPAVDNGRGR